MPCHLVRINLSTWQKDQQTKLCKEIEDTIFWRLISISYRLQPFNNNATIERKSEGKQKREKRKKDGKQKEP